MASKRGRLGIVLGLSLIGALVLAGLVVQKSPSGREAAVAETRAYLVQMQTDFARVTRDSPAGSVQEEFARYGWAFGVATMGLYDLEIEDGMATGSVVALGVGNEGGLSNRDVSTYACAHLRTKLGSGVVTAVSVDCPSGVMSAAWLKPYEQVRVELDPVNIADFDVPPLREDL